MSLNGNPTVVHPPAHVIWSAIVAALVMFSMLVGLLAMHSTGAGHSTGAESVASARSAHIESAAPSGQNSATALAGVAATSVSLAVESVSNVSHSHGGLFDCAHCLLNCALLAMTCAVLLVLAALVLFARQPAVFSRLLDAGGRIVRSFRGPPRHIYRPSLIVLSISRT